MRAPRTLAPMTRALRWTGVAFAVAFALHGADHLRRGLDASPPSVMLIGTVQGVLVAVSAWVTWRGVQGAWRWAAVVGPLSLLLVTIGHLLPASDWHVGDSFVSPPATNVAWTSWASALLEMGAGLAYGVVGMLSRRS